MHRLLHSRWFAICGILLLGPFVGVDAAYAQGLFGAGGFGGGQFGQGGFGGGGLGGFGGGGLGGGGLGGGQAGQGGLAGAAGAAGGVFIDAQGVVKAVFVKEKSGKLDEQRMQAAAQKFLPADMNRFSPLRKVSLVRLEALCEEYARRKEHVPVDMHFLAGLQRIDYVFVYPETGDLVIAGPAEGFAPDPVGRVVGLTTGRPPLRIDDLTVALRALERAGTLGCSIDPDQGRLAEVTRYIKSNSSAASPQVIARRFDQMGKILGLQDVRVWGVPAESHFAQTLVEADLRMKRLAVGLDATPVRGLQSHLSMIRPNGNTMQRWWFTPLYEAFVRTEDGNAFQLAGQRMQLSAQEEVADAAGKRSDAPFTRITTQQFAKQFTEKIPELADAEPVFAELQSLIDLAIVAALLKKEQLPQKVGWKMALFLDSERARMIEGQVPKQTETVVNYRRANRGMILGLVSGGVTVDAMATIRNVPIKTEGAERLAGIYANAAEQQAEQDPWWWD